ncbi:hypothetical protein CONPUDRAFT_140266 [Coniophora puteana RWD-64-598 SS2]|uniref:Uncharacterized protein n=1 Tax=Coniophora puteana (strain RWD-64-598) TaxID=741705 RepID=A0A5M3M605_CONPW|nr:uncharacterized protein CONPUDRAFT_140266 [Coniophora puteana RWD-64-598 SS2]EIW74808.1 hypothetical protein CONPUDRAFT_140266 [Coniophora puteana RWD-64-598 SS2]
MNQYNGLVNGPLYGRNPNISRFIVRSSDVISDLRINVHDEESDKVVWYKERFLNDTEIVEHVVHNHTSKICWTIHRPKRGWYIRLRAPSFPPGFFIALAPVPRSSPDYIDAALAFACRVNVRLPPAPPFSPASPSSPSSSMRPRPTSADSTLSGDTVVHSYPPTPPAAAAAPIIVTPPSPEAVAAKLDDSPPVTRKRRPKPKPVPTTVSRFVLAPHAPYAYQTAPRMPGGISLAAAVPEQKSSFFSRALSMFSGGSGSSTHASSSFALRIAGDPLPSPMSSASPPAGCSSSKFPEGPSSSSQLPTILTTPPAPPPPPPPLLTFHDQTPVWTVRSVTGLLEINRAEERVLGVDTSFWIAAALTYLEFLEDRDSYLAALSD